MLGAAVVVHLDPSGRAPHTAVEILLDDGPIVRGMLTDGEPPALGTRMHGALVPETDGEVPETNGEGNDVVELRFEPDTTSSRET